MMDITRAKCSDCGTLVVILHPGDDKVDKDQFKRLHELLKDAAANPCVTVTHDHGGKLKPVCIIGDETTVKRILSMIDNTLED